MTFKELMRENGYEVCTTFWEDFSIADKFGINAVKDTFQRAFEEWKDNYIYLTELCLVLNHKIWQHHSLGNNQNAELYDNLWRQVDEYGMNNLQGEELDYFIRILD